MGKIIQGIGDVSTVRWKRAHLYVVSLHVLHVIGVKEVALV